MNDVEPGGLHWAHIIIRALQLNRSAPSWLWILFRCFRRFALRPHQDCWWFSETKQDWRLAILGSNRCLNPLVGPAYYLANNYPLKTVDVLHSLYILMILFHVNISILLFLPCVRSACVTVHISPCPVYLFLWVRITSYGIDVFVCVCVLQRWKEEFLLTDVLRSGEWGFGENGRRKLGRSRLSQNRVRRTHTHSPKTLTCSVPWYLKALVCVQMTSPS